MGVKVLLFLLFIGYATASVYDALDDAADEFVASFMRGLDRAPSLSSALGVAHSTDIKRAEEDTKTDLGKHLREALNKVLERIKDAMEQGKSIRDETIAKLKELREKMKEAKVDMGNKAKELLEIIKEKAKEFLRELLEKLGGRKYTIDDFLDTSMADIDIRQILKELKKELLTKVDKEVIKERIKKLLGQTGELLEQLLKVLREKGREKLLDLVDLILGDDDDDDDEEGRNSRAVKDVWEKVKNHFKEVNEDFKEKLQKFGDWVKGAIKTGINESKDKLEEIKQIAMEYVKRSKVLGKVIAVEALEFLRPYREELGSLWDEAREAARDVLVDDIRDLIQKFLPKTIC